MRRITHRTFRASRKRWAIGTTMAMALSGVGGPALVPTTSAQAPVGAGFVLDARDLRFIFHQIEIAQAHAAGGELFGPGANQVPEARLPFGLRTVDGSFNHLTPNQTAFGAADQIFPRLTPAVFRPGEPFDPDRDGPAPAVPTSYTQTRGVVADSQPRVISNLVADQTVNNPAAVAAAGAGADVEPLGTLAIPNVAPDVGLSAPFNVMFTFFGQFFDHGLDLVTKGGGTVFVPLKDDDPLIAGPDHIRGNADDLPADQRFMILTRATNLPGPDGISGDNPATPQDESADDIHEATNTTTPFVDQNQTYTSHPSHQVFLREYVLNAQGRPVSTGRMIDGGGTINGVPVRNIGNWGEVKAQAAALLGIALGDADVFNVPLLATDPYGRFLRGPNGFPLLIMASGPPREGSRDAPIATAGSRKTGHGFLDDIAHNAVPRPGLAPDDDSGISRAGDPQPPGTYDNELLDRHFVTGDGRGNENIALTAVHTIFHAEHNRLAGYIDGLIPALLTPTEVAAWHAVDAASGWDYGERLFQAAKFVTEMQYQHLVFEEFARKLVPTINAFQPDGINFQSDLNPAITAEFAHQTYRLGHSMLTETISRINGDGTTSDIPLLDGFLNPLAFNDGGPAGPLTAAQAAGAIWQGGTRQVGHEIDEFVTEAVRNRLLGLPLDLAVLNLSRGRSEGIPGLNAVRRQLFLRSGDSSLTPYSDWFDFSFALRHAESLVNFIAAYGVHPTLAAAATLVEKRAAAEALANDPGFMFGPAADTGVETIDLWIGGLAEKIAPFGSMLGPTFTYVFEHQLESLQNADRFYYLERLDGLNLLVQLEGNSFSELISRNTTAAGMSADVFNRPDFVFNVTNLGTTGPVPNDPSTTQDESALLVRLPDGTLRFDGGEHVIWNGSNARGDRIWSSEGDDTLRGDGGNDWMEGGSGNDNHLGGDGDDTLVDLFGDDVMKGGPGNDAISGGPGFDLLQGNEGNDFIVAGNDASEIFGGPGNDVMFTGDGATESFAGAGDDWMEGGNQLNLLVGDENNQFQDDADQGHDVIIGGTGDDDFDSEGGDDIMVAGVLGTDRLEGMLGFDWVTYRGDPLPVDADMSIRVVLPPNLDELRDRYDLVEALSGYNRNDILRGEDRTAAAMTGHELTAAGIARINGLSAFLNGATSFTGGNIIIGGAGSDIIEGRGGDDIIDGDAWLNVQLRAPNPATPDPNDFQLVNTLRALQADVFAGRINPGSISIVRSIVTGDSAPSDVDTAVFSGLRAEYAITVNANGTITVAHVGGTTLDGIDTLRNIEQLQFADVTIPTSGIGALLVPNLAGLTENAAMAAVVGAGLRLGTVSTINSPTLMAGFVVDQSPLAGVGVPSGTAVSFVVSLGPQVPAVHDETVADATAAIEENGLRVGTITSVNNPTVEAGRVILQSPLPGSTVLPGSAINLTVSLGPSTAGRVPAVVGLLRVDATSAITSASLTTGAVTFANSATVEAGRVISTNPAAGVVLAPGSAVGMSVSLGNDGLVLAFGFEEASGTAAVDSSLTGLNGTIRGAARVAGKFGRALRFDGVDDWVTVPDTTSSPLDLTTGMTIEAWVNPTEMAGWETAVLKERGTGMLSYALYAHDGAPETLGFAAPAGYTRTVSSSTDRGVRTAAPLPLGVWTHIATTYDGSSMRLYLNGALVATQPQTGNLAVSNGALRVGGNTAFATEFYRGLIDEVRIYNRARTAAQIVADMNTAVRP